MSKKELCMEYYYLIKETILDEEALVKLDDLEWAKVPLTHSVNIQKSDFEIGKNRNYFYLFEIYKADKHGPGMYLFILRNDKTNGKQHFLSSLSNQIPTMEWINRLLSENI